MRDLSEYAGILLAAGRGRRFDSTGVHDKLLQHLASGEIVATRSAMAMCAVLPRVVAVVRPDAGMVHTRLADLGCEVVTCAAADEGMGASLACAVAHAQEAAGWVIGLADMPFVQATTFHAVLDALKNGADIAVPVYQGRRGNPAGFSCKYLPDLLSMAGDQGARRLIHSFPVTEVAVDDPGIHADIDTIDDLGGPHRGDVSA
jgi:molybdenum cofactor cytidylyltransferase